MSQKNETAVLLFSLLITVGLLGMGYWWFRQNLGGGLSPQAVNPSGTISPSPVSQQPQQASGDSFAKVSNVPSGLFNYGGSTTWAPIRRDIDREIQTAVPNFQLRYTDPVNDKPGSGSGIKMLLENQLAFSQSSRSIQDGEYKQAEQKGFKLKEIPVAIDGIAIAINPNLSISGLTVAQIEDIYLGKIVNWKQVGGPDLAIVPYSRRKEDSGTVEFFMENVLEKQNFGTEVQLVPSTTLALRKVAENLGAIYYASAPEVVAQCTVKTIAIGRKPEQLVAPYKEPFVPLNKCPGQLNQLNAEAFRSAEYPITRTLFVIVKQNGQVDQQAGEAYANLLLSSRGQELIEKTGFVRIR